MIRRYQPADAAALATVFYRSVREGAEAYSPEQRAAWVPEMPRLLQWQARLSSLTVFVADQVGPVGFLAMEGAYMDLTYVLPELRGTGVTAQLYDAALVWAKEQGHTRLICESSHHMRSFLEKRDWQVDAAQEVERHGVLIPNFRMSVAI
jgi:putative acetyltransferase